MSTTTSERQAPADFPTAGYCSPPCVCGCSSHDGPCPCGACSEYYADDVDDEIGPEWPCGTQARDAYGYEACLAATDISL